MLDQLATRLQTVFRNLRGFGKLSESNVADACRQIRMALLEADVHFNVARELVEAVKNRALGAEVLQSITPGQQMVKIFHDELVRLLGASPPLAAGSPLRILLCGLQGSGKTTTAAKLAAWFKRNGRHPLLVAADLQRPAAIDQLETLARMIDIPVTADRAAKDPAALAAAALAHAAGISRNTVIVDTAGRLDLDGALLDELARVRDALRPQEILFVADAALGQKSVEIVQRFHAAVPLTGLILTRLDGDARGGAAISMRHVTGLPIQFLGTGEKPDQFERMDAARLAGRILGMGDIVGLVEKAAEAAAAFDGAAFEDKFRRNAFGLDDMLGQLRQVRKLGPVQNLLGMMPGMPNLPDPAQAETRLKRTEAILLSMTPQERRRPELLNARRRQRIARGSGTTVTAVNDLLNQFGSMRKMMKSKGKMKKLLGRFAAGGGFGTR